MISNPHSQLKDFQIATVDYVFQRFTDSENPCNRFLIADEVGLGKTLVARGIIHKFYDYYKSSGLNQLKVIYICSNQSIANQNISRLNIESDKSHSLSQIHRINDLAVTNINHDGKSFLDIIALSPNTSFNISRGGGIVKERAIIYHILRKHPDFRPYKRKLKRIFQLDVKDENWEWWVNFVETQLRDEIVAKFNYKLNPTNDMYWALFKACEERFGKKEFRDYRRLIGGLRKLLASICVSYLQPDLIIMDEFQRFKYLIDLDEDSEAKLITESLFTNDKINILLLSATPYKMYVMQSEEDEGESHFEEFKFIVDFLLNDEIKRKQFEEAWKVYSNSLIHLQQGNWDLIRNEKNKVERLLKDVIARTERITVSDDRNTMLQPSKSDILWINQDDILSFISADSVALKLNNVNSPIEYCKSSAFPFSFMEGYQLQKIAQKEIEKGNGELKSALKKNNGSFLPVSIMDKYQQIGSPNAKLAYLLNDSLYNGGSDLLWVPPSLPYYEFEAPFAGNELFSKSLVFSSWIMVPKMIAALSSYECERLTIGNENAINNADDRSERKYFQTGSERNPKARLRFRIERNNYSTLSSYALLYPCITLSNLWKPAIKTTNLTSLISDLATNIKSLIAGISIKEFISEPNKKDDDRWALIYMLLLDRKNNLEQINHIKQCENEYNWDWLTGDSDVSVASQYYKKVFTDILFVERPKFIPAWELARGVRPENAIRNTLIQLRLGQPPADIEQKLAYLTIASPAICSYRLLNSFSRTEKDIDYISFFGAFQVADNFRKFFNVSENIAVVDKYAIKDKSYWENVLIYSASGNFQSMLDEFANAMVDHNGLWNITIKNKLQKLITILSENIGLRTVSVAGHTYDSFVKDSKPNHFRCHFGVALSQSLDNEKNVIRSDNVRDAFNSPFRPFILATTSIGQEGLDFHLYCRKILHWNLPANPVDFEQREGRINRFKNLAIRQNLALKYRNELEKIDSSNIWEQLFQLAIEHEKGNKSDLVPYWHVEPEHVFIERQVPTIPYSKEVKKLNNLLKTISVYRIALGQPRQEELVNHLIENLSAEEIENVQRELLINLSPILNYKTMNN